MKTKLLALVTLFSFYGCAVPLAKTEKIGSFVPKTYKRVAILPLSSDRNNLGGAISDALITDFLSMRWDVLERTQMRAVLKEIHINLNGIASPNQAKEIGKLLSVDALVMGTLIGYHSGQVKAVNVRMVDANTGVILWSSSFDSGAVPASVGDSMKSIRESLKDKLLGQKREIGTSPKSIILSRNTNVVRKKYSKIAILPLLGPNYYGEGDDVLGKLTTEFIGHKISLVERADLETILGEQFKTSAGLYAGSPLTRTDISSSVISGAETLSTADLHKLGEISGADALLVGSFSRPDNDLTPHIANLRLLDIESGRIAWSATYYGPRGSSTKKGSILLPIALAPAISTYALKDFRPAFDAAIKKTSVMVQASDFDIIQGQD